MAKIGRALHILGTPNGVLEIASAAIEIIKKERIELLVLEAPEESKEYIVKYLRGSIKLDEITIVHPKKPHDGRCGTWIRKLLIYAKKNNIMVLPLNTTDPSPQSREEEFARKINNLATKPTLFVCGEIHASKCLVKFGLLARIYVWIFWTRRDSQQHQSMKPFKPCAALLNHRCISYRLIARKRGFQYNFRIRSVLGELKARSIQLQNSRPRIILGDECYDKYVVVRSLTASD